MTDRPTGSSPDISGGNVTSSASAISARSRAMSARSPVSSASCTCIMARIWVSSSLMSIWFCATRSPSCTSNAAMMPPSRCCMVLRLPCTSSAPVPTTAPSSGASAAHPPKPPKKMAMVARPVLMLFILVYPQNTPFIRIRTESDIPLRRVDEIHLGAHLPGQCRGVGARWWTSSTLLPVEPQALAAIATVLGFARNSRAGSTRTRLPATIVAT